ncbi:MAG: hypothetical protein AAF533_10335 [Acidobacteriota bacterium]
MMVGLWRSLLERLGFGPPREEDPEPEEELNPFEKIFGKIEVHEGPFEPIVHENPVFGRIDTAEASEWKVEIDHEGQVLEVSASVWRPSFDPDELDELTAHLQDLPSLQDSAREALIVEHEEEGPSSTLTYLWEDHLEKEDSRGPLPGDLRTLTRGFRLKTVEMFLFNENDFRVDLVHEVHGRRTTVYFDPDGRARTVINGELGPCRTRRRRYVMTGKWADYRHPIFGPVDPETSESWDWYVDFEDDGFEHPTWLWVDIETFDPVILEQMTEVLNDLPGLEERCLEAALRDHYEMLRTKPGEQSALAELQEKCLDDSLAVSEERKLTDEERIDIEAFADGCFLYRFSFHQDGGQHRYVVELQNPIGMEEYLTVSFDADGEARNVWLDRT